MADDVEPGGAERIGEVEHVVDEPRCGIRLDGGRADAGGVAALVDGDRAVAGGGQVGHDVAPRVTRLREPVQQQHE